LEWVSRSENLVVAGPQGTGKSHLLEAIGHHAVDQGLQVAWFSIEDLGAIIRRHRVDDSVSKAFVALASTSLSVIDDIGLLPISTDAAEGLYRLVDAAYERRSIALSSNLHPSKAHRFARTCARWRLIDTGSLKAGQGAVRRRRCRPGS
jgi:DNA replication protein DnaC